MEKLTQEDIDWVEVQEFMDTDYTKSTILKLQKIKNFLTEGNDNDCMCSSTTRKRLKKEFYVFWNNFKADKNNVGI